MEFMGFSVDGVLGVALVLAGLVMPIVARSYGGVLPGINIPAG